MGRYSKPSRGCKTCKARHVKCDEGKPACGPCLRSKKECLGYEDDVDVLFRNENTRVEQRVKRKYKRKQGSSTASPSSATAEFSPQSALTPLPNEYIFRQPTLDPEAEALAFLFKDQIAPPKPTARYSNPTAALYAQYTVAPDDALIRKATGAIALGAFTQAAEHLDFRVYAQRAYGKALQRLNRAIGDQNLVKTDDVLQSVLLLATYDTTIGAPNARKSWLHHMHGAVAICRARGPAGFTSPVSKYLFQGVRYPMLAISAAKKEHFELFPGQPNGECEGLPPSGANNLLQLLTRLINFRARHKNVLSTAQEGSDIDVLIHQVTRFTAFDDELKAWKSTLQPDWFIGNLPSTIQSSSGGGAAQRFKVNIQRPMTAEASAREDAIARHVLDDYEAGRMMCQDGIVQCIDQLPTGYKSEEMMVRRNQAARLRGYIASRFSARQTAREQANFSKVEPKGITFAKPILLSQQLGFAQGDEKIVA